MNHQTSRIASRRQFIKVASFAVPVFPSLLFGALKCNNSPLSVAQLQTKVGGGCDGCELIYEGMPKELHWQTKITPASEPGEPLEISGIIYQRDGKTPAPNVILYVYHTDAKGYYSPFPNQTPGRRHGHLRGWMKTNAKGEYQFTSIRPAAYPNRPFPAHIHPIIKEPDKNEYWIDEYVFDDDPLLTKAERGKVHNRGGSGIMYLKKQNGVWVGKRDITLGLNIPDYR
ncbi:MAG: intradiol ring-cleavage dioxygenase [Acidobacteriota bacterium]